jgi:para-nitrobenzyl esterase
MSDKLAWCVNRRDFVRGGSAGLLLLGVGGPAWAAGSDVIVETAGGRVRGQGTAGIARFLGIPYGADTGGANRFLPPKLAAPWSGVRDATFFGSSAPQTNPNPQPIPAAMQPMMALFPRDPKGVAESEDCLRLNVWTPSPNRQSKKPVMVWLHGGGYSLGSGSWPIYEGSNFARTNDMVLVSVNHRLNMFGYAYMAEALGADYRTSANVGQLDIVLALQWIRDNIAAFGGDPGNVTIRGQSGGGSKVSVLMAMPAAHGLFHKAIIESGPALRAGTPEAAAKNAARLIETLGGKDKLRTASTQELLAAFFAMQTRLPGGGGGGAGGFSPVVDGVALPRHPFDPDATPLSAQIPLLIGSTHHEQATFLFGQPVADDAALRTIVQRLAPKGVDRAIAAYRTAYPQASPRELAILIGTDAGTGSRTRLLADRKSVQPAPVYSYRFDWETKVLGGQFRATHGMDTSFIFNNTGIDPLVGGDPTAKALAQKVSRSWGAFARTGNPTVAGGLGTWPRYTAAERKMMVVNNQSRVEADPGGKLKDMLAGLA